LCLKDENDRKIICITLAFKEMTILEYGTRFLIILCTSIQGLKIIGFKVDV